MALCLSAPILIAQQQERTLIDRLLRPDMQLQNNAESKKFATHSAAIEQHGTVGTFLVQPRSPEKPFADPRMVSTKQFSAASETTTVSTASFIVDQKPDLRPPVTASNIVGVRSVENETKQFATANFADQHLFRKQGKCQKSLDRKNPPLTIEQVRELLNKNK